MRLASGQTDGQTDRQMDTPFYRDATAHPKQKPAGLRAVWQWVPGATFSEHCQSILWLSLPDAADAMSW